MTFLIFGITVYRTTLWTMYKIHGRIGLSAGGGLLCKSRQVRFGSYHLPIYIRCFAQRLRTYCPLFDRRRVLEQIYPS